MTHVLLYSLSLFCLTITILLFICTAMWGQWAVPAYFQSKRLLPFGFAGQSNSTILKLYSVHQLSIGCVLLCIAR